MPEFHRGSILQLLKQPLDASRGLRLFFLMQDRLLWHPETRASPEDYSECKGQQRRALHRLQTEFSNPKRAIVFRLEKQTAVVTERQAQLFGRPRASHTGNWNKSLGVLV